MSDFRAQLEALMMDLQTPDLAPFRQRSQQLKQKHSPRNRFNQWRKSEEGKAWKQQQFEQVQGHCQCCHETFSPANLAIDHIQPIAIHPELALEAKNFQLLCYACNQSKGSHSS